MQVCKSNQHEQRVLPTKLSNSVPVTLFHLNYLLRINRTMSPGETVVFSNVRCSFPGRCFQIQIEKILQYSVLPDKVCAGNGSYTVIFLP